MLCFCVWLYVQGDSGGIQGQQGPPGPKGEPGVAALGYSVSHSCYTNRFGRY